MDYTLLWLIIAILFLGVELLSPGLFYSLSFAIGAFAAMVGAHFLGSVMWQMVLFLAATVGAMVLLRRFVAQRTGAYRPTSNVYALIGKKGVLVVAPAGQQLGYVKVSGEMWACRTVDQESIGVDAQVIVVAVKGSHLIVRSIN
jgi:membrane protein implicated in regulation of membrane protease activity